MQQWYFLIDLFSLKPRILVWKSPKRASILYTRIVWLTNCYSCLVRKELGLANVGLNCQKIATAIVQINIYVLFGDQGRLGFRDPWARCHHGGYTSISFPIWKFAYKQSQSVVFGRPLCGPDHNQISSLDSRNRSRGGLRLVPGRFHICPVVQDGCFQVSCDVCDTASSKCRNAVLRRACCLRSSLQLTTPTHSHTISRALTHTHKRQLILYHSLHNAAADITSGFRPVSIPTG